MAMNQGPNAVMICSFKSDFFTEYSGTKLKIFAIYTRNLKLMTEAHKNSILSLKFLIRGENYLDCVIDYNSGVEGSHGVPMKGEVGELAKGGGPGVGIESDAWVSAPAAIWTDRLLRLFPAPHEFLAFRFAGDGLEVRNFDIERTSPGSRSYPIMIPSHYFDYNLKHEMEATCVSLPRMKSFLEMSKKCGLLVQLKPDLAEDHSQLTWQAFNEERSVFFTLIMTAELANLSPPGWAGSVYPPQELHGDGVNSIKKMEGITEDLLRELVKLRVMQGETLSIKKSNKEYKLQIQILEKEIEAAQQELNSRSFPAKTSEEPEDLDSEIQTIKDQIQTVRNQKNQIKQKYSDFSKESPEEENDPKEQAQELQIMELTNEINFMKEEVIPVLEQTINLYQQNKSEMQEEYQSLQKEIQTLQVGTSAPHKEVSSLKKSTPKKTSPREKNPSAQSPRSSNYKPSFLRL
eukprot:CAMPEP_0202440468 /NCGR_PEP_ID=MMETSP1345-20130828/36707_1 /ASSEMBLY_ACC=CAM_ASM_000843 /TAXON_ID=342563 /ORGANISM="Fabrea Fabrea salina" /LENGTH=460 /DNA_ID=CAMNT_0049055069 /DNA_START=920 /DNA_END=2298 /DNA_ORIENTATION=+